MQATYPDLAAAMRGVCCDWCQRHGYTDPFRRNGEWWAFPPNGVMPIKIQEVLSDPAPAQWVQIGRVSLALLPDGSLASVLVIDGAGSPDQTSQSPADKPA